MKLVVNLKLQPTESQKASLLDTLERCNQACNWISQQGFESGIFGQYALHRAFYRTVREKFGLSAQMAVRSIAKVADVYKDRSKRTTLAVFRSRGAQPYDDRIIRFAKNDIINIWTLNGREKIPFVCGDYQRKLIPHRKGEVELLYVRGKWYVSCVVDIDEPIPDDPKGVLGVDFGIVNIATDSTGESYSGAQVDTIREKSSKRRSVLQKVGSKAAKRRLKSLSGKQSRFQSITNHVISKAIVAKAKRSQSSIALEDLKGIRDRVKATKSQRQRLSNWGFWQLRNFIEYKAKIAGVLCFIVSARNTSRTCPMCGCIDKANRPTQELFRCVTCGYSNNADLVAAGNIAGRVAVTQPMFAHLRILDAVESHPL
jgi:putative transposase